MKHHKSVEPAMTKASQGWLIVSLTVAALPHFFYQPVWVIGLFTSMMMWRLAALIKQWPLPTQQKTLKRLHALAALFTIGLIINHYGMTIGRDAGAALLTIMAAFKVVEMKTARDFYLSCFLGFFLIITNFFYSQSMALVLLMFVAVTLLTTSLISLHHSATPRHQPVKLASLLLLQSVPMMLILFVLFPRVPGPIWGLPSDAITSLESMPDGITLGDTATTGVSDSIQMGRISQLIQSDAIAFRVSFTDNLYPPQYARYWRGPVLWQTDGTQWLPLNKAQLDNSPLVVNVRGQAYQYTSTIEAHQRNWLFALDFSLVDNAQPYLQLQADGLLQHKDKLTQRTQVSLTAYPHYQLNPDQDGFLEAGLQLPENKHPRARQLALTLHRQAEDEQGYIDNVLQHFNQNAFSYTLTPPVLYGDTVDQFLFESQSGFCEHYAASFTVLMRAAGIPARIVTGYLGGEVNPINNLMVVRQRDAHAWVEVWLENRGWIRVDPTTSVASERVNLGINPLLPSSRRAPNLLADNDQLIKIWQSFRHTLDAVNSSWDLWVVGYGPAKQLELLNRWGMQQPNWQKMIVWLGIGLFSVVILITLLMRWQRRLSNNTTHFYQLFCQQLTRLNIQRAADEGPQHFAARAAQQLPEYSRQIEVISRLYQRLRYRNEHALEQKFIQHVKQFKPKR